MDIADCLIDFEVEIQTFQSPHNHITGSGLPILVTAITTWKQGAVVIYTSECSIGRRCFVLCCDCMHESTLTSHFCMFDSEICLSML